MSKNRNKHRRAIRSEAAALPPSTYIVLDAGGQRRPLSPIRFRQYVASHVIVPIAVGAAIARVRPGYTVKLDKQQEAVVVEVNPQMEQHFKFRSNYWTAFWRAFIFDPRGRYSSLTEMLRAIAEDHQEPQYEVVERRLGVLA